MPHSRPARVLATLLACLRFTVIAVVGLVVLAVVRGTPVHADALPVLRLIDGGANATGDLRTDLQSLLAHNSTLTVRFMRATVAGRPEFVEAADAVVVGSTADLEQTLRPAIGGEAAAQFAKRWETRTNMLFRYAAGARDGNEAARQEAARQLRSLDRVIASVLTDATDGRLSERDVADRLTAQTDDLLAQTDEFAAADHDRAFRLQRRAFARTYPVGALVSAAATDAPGALPPAAQLRVSLGRLLGEHVELTVDTMRAAAVDPAQFEAAAGVLDANTADLAAATDSLLGDDADAVNALWADQLDELMRATVAITESDDAALDEARAGLSQVADRFGTVLGGLDEEVDVETAVDAVRRHHQLAVAQLEHAVAREHTEAHDAAYGAFINSRRLADALAATVAELVDDTLPVGGAATGGGASSWSGLLP